MPNKLFLALQYLLPHFLLTRFAGWMSTRTTPWLKNFLITYFIRRYKVDMSLAVSDQLTSYPTFNAFFTRALKPSARPLHPDSKVIISPIDGCISQIGQIQEGSLLQAKGAYYSVNSLLGKPENQETPFQEGLFATFYLSPKDYHRVHLPYAAKLVQTTYLPGKLFSVNPLAAANIPQLFSRNERLVCLFETTLGPMAVVFIGAMLVGKIETIWGLVERSKTPVTRKYSDHEALQLTKGAEIGRFLLGSSVILLFPKASLQWLPELQAQSKVEMGQAIGTVIS